MSPSVRIRALRHHRLNGIVWYARQFQAERPGSFVLKTDTSDLPDRREARRRTRADADARAREAIAPRTRS